jgi:hypothetical protein
MQSQPQVRHLPPPVQPSTAPMDLIIVGLTLLAPALGGSTRLWAQALVVLACALVMLAAPSGTRLPRMLRFLFAGFLLLGCAGFLPATWFALPPWRHTLQTDYQLPLANTLSPQPWLTLEILLLLFATVVWGGYLCTRRWESRRRTLVAVYCAGLLGLIGVALVADIGGFQIPIWQPVGGAFGFFPNRNQTGNLIALGGLCLLALAFQAFSRKKKAGYAWAAGYIVSMIAVVVNHSRAGVGIFFLGSLVWVLWVSAGSGEKRTLGLGLSAVLLLFTGFLLFGGRTLERFTGSPDRPMDVTTDLRFKIYSDALKLLPEVSWHGVGLGNFEPVFALHRVKSAGNNRLMHPESDWFWTGIELGWVAPVLVLAGAIFWLVRHWPERSAASFYLLSAIAVGVIAFLAHGLVDVSGHRLGTLWPMIFLASLLRDSRNEDKLERTGTMNRSGLNVGQASRLPSERKVLPTSRRQGVSSAGEMPAARYGSSKEPEQRRGVSRAYRLAAVLLAMTASAWLLSAFGAAPFPTSASLERVRRDLVRAHDMRSFDFVIRLANEGLRFAPLNWELYFHRALAQARLSPHLDEMQMDFRRARFLEPNMVAVPFEEGQVWLAREPRLALGAWNAALRRAGPDKAALYRQMLSDAAGTPEIRDDLRALALDEPELLLVFLAQATPQEAAVELDRVLTEDPTLKTLAREQQKVFFLLWAKHGNKELLHESFRANPAWLETGWPAYALVLAGRGNVQEACELVSSRVAEPALPAFTLQKPVAELRRALLLSTNDFVIGFALYQAQLAANETDDALETLRKLTAAPDCPRYFFYLHAQIAMKRGAWEDAWRAWKKFLAV